MRDGTGQPGEEKPVRGSEQCLQAYIMLDGWTIWSLWSFLILMLLWLYDSDVKIMGQDSFQ